MKLILFVSLVCIATAFPLEDDLLEGSGQIAVEADSDVEPVNFDEVTDQTDPASVQARSAKNLAEIMSQMFESDESKFSHSYSSSDGTAVESSGELKQIGDGVGTVMRGSYYYVAPGGEKVKITWVANEKGFQAFGDMVPETPAYVADLLKSTEPVSDSSTVSDVAVPAEDELLVAANDVEDAADPEEPVPALLRNAAASAEDVPAPADDISAVEGDNASTVQSASTIDEDSADVEDLFKAAEGASDISDASAPAILEPIAADFKADPATALDAFVSKREVDFAADASDTAIVLEDSV